MKFLFAVQYKSVAPIKEKIQADYDVDLYDVRNEQKEITADTFELALTGLQSYVAGLGMIFVSAQLLNILA